MTTRDLKQGSSAWLSARVGNVTASRVKDVMAVNKDGKSSAARQNYMIELICERLTGFAVSHFVTDAMAVGIANEPLSRANYEFRTGNDVDLVGMALHPRIPQFAASPDGLVGVDGLWESKSPTTAKHVAWMLAGEVPEEHKPQMHAQLACFPERKWNDFTSFDGRVPPRHQLFIKRLMRDDERIAEVEAAVEKFLAETFELMHKLEELNGPDVAVILQKEMQVRTGELEDGISDEDIAWVMAEQCKAVQAQG